MQKAHPFTGATDRLTGSLEHRTSSMMYGASDLAGCSAAHGCMVSLPGEEVLLAVQLIRGWLLGLISTGC
jgi:hypothetical protein